MASTRPNLLFICPDQLGAWATGPYGHETVRTPTLDRLAREGVVFERFYATAALCGPCRWSLFTGRMPFGQANWANPNCAVLPGIEYMGDAFRRQGYFTGALGKLHGMPEDADFGFEHTRLQDVKDFDRWVETRLEDRPDAGRIRAALAAKGYHRQADGDCAPDQYLPPDLSEEAWIVDEARTFLDTRPEDKPFLLSLLFKHPHPGWETEEADADRYDPEAVPLRPTHDADVEAKPILRTFASGHDYSGPAHRADWEKAHWRRQMAKYLASVTQVDRAIGAVLDMLEARGLMENTYVVLTTDHGEMMGSFGIEGKYFFYEDAVRLPFLVTGPTIPAGVRREQLAQQTDLLPTLLDLAGLEIPDYCEGISLKAALEADAPTRPCIHAWMELRGRYHQMSITARHKLYRARGLPNAMTGHLPPAVELYDLVEDPHELNDLFDHPDTEVTRALKEEFCDYFGRTVGRLWGGPEVLSTLLPDTGRTDVQGTGYLT